MKHIVNIQRLGCVKYSDALKIQKEAAFQVAKSVAKSKEPVHKLILLEHPPVYTTGIRSHVYSSEEEEKLRELGADFHRTDRGGLITFHGPGQLVVYPILHLRSFKQGIKWYVCALERAIIQCCHDLNIKGYTSPHTGIWVNDKKICAIGVQGRHVTTHGLALNCNTDLSWFDHIVPCGIVGKSVTSISAEINKTFTVDEACPIFLKSFSDIFNADLIEEEI